MKFRTLSKQGNSLALTLEKPILELLGIDNDTIIEVTTDGKSLILTPVHDQEAYKKRFQEALKRTSDKYQEAFRQMTDE